MERERVVTPCNFAVILVGRYPLTITGDTAGLLGRVSERLEGFDRVISVGRYRYGRCETVGVFVLIVTAIVVHLCVIIEIIDSVCNCMISHWPALPGCGRTQ